MTYSSIFLQYDNLRVYRDSTDNDEAKTLIPLEETSVFLSSKVFSLRKCFAYAIKWKV